MTHIWNLSVNRISLKVLLKRSNLFQKSGKFFLYIDLILTNVPYSFQNSFLIEIDLSDFHKIIVLFQKTTKIET